MPSTAFRIGPLCVSPSIRIGVSHCPIGGLLRFCGDFWRWPAKASTMDLCVGHVLHQLVLLLLLILLQCLLLLVFHLW